MLGHLRPVELEIVVGQQRVVLLAGLGLEPLELFERALARLFEQALLEIRRDLDRVDAEIAVVVQLDGCVPRRAGCLLVRSEERVLERLDERVAVDALLALDRADRFDDLSRHRACLPFVDQVAPHDCLVRDVYRLVLGANRHGPLARVDHFAAHAALCLGAQGDAAADDVAEVLRSAQRPRDAG